MIAWLTAGVAATAALWTIGLFPPFDRGHGDPTGPALAILWVCLPYVAFAALAHAWRRSRAWSCLLLSITALIAGSSTWIYSELLRPGNSAGLASPWIAIYQWCAIAGLLPLRLLVESVKSQSPRKP